MGEKEMLEIIDRIKTKRKELDLSYQDLADKTGLSKSTLQRYETGSIKNMPIDKLDLIAKALNTTPDYLMGWESSQTKNKRLINLKNENSSILVLDITLENFKKYKKCFDLIFKEVDKLIFDFSPHTISYNIETNEQLEELDFKSINDFSDEDKIPMLKEIIHRIIFNKNNNTLQVTYKF